MKTVASGENYTTVTVDTAEAVKFSFASTFLSVKVIEGEITVALTETAQAGDDGTITVSEGETEMFNHYRMNVDTYYLTGSGKAVLHASNMSDVNPFEGKGKGGDGGGTLGIEEVVLWENDGTTNPQTITLSEALSNFDELIAVTDYIEGSRHYIDTHSILVDAVIVGNPIYLWYNDNQEAASYIVESATLLTLDDTVSIRHVTKIIGRRYTRANPTGYGETILFETHTWHTNDIVPSDSLTNYDAFAVEYEITENPNEPRGVLYYLKSTWFDAQGGVKGQCGAAVSCWDIFTNIERVVGYQVKSALLLKCTAIGSRNTANSGVFVSKLIGIKY